MRLVPLLALVLVGCAVEAEESDDETPSELAAPGVPVPPSDAAEPLCCNRGECVACEREQECHRGECVPSCESPEACGEYCEGKPFGAVCDLCDVEGFCGKEKCLPMSIALKDWPSCAPYPDLGGQ